VADFKAGKGEGAQLARRRGDEEDEGRGGCEEGEGGIDGEAGVVGNHSLIV